MRARERELYERMAMERSAEECATQALRGLDTIARSIAEATETSREG
jgi:hypothetical protein